MAEETKRIVHDGQGYFRAIGTMLDGGEFTALDRAKSDPVVIVNQAFVNRLGLGGPIPGRQVSDWRRAKQYTIVGIAADERVMGPSGQPQPLAYFPVNQWAPSAVTFVARVRRRTEDYLAVCRDALRQVDPHVPVYDVTTLDQRLADNLKRPRFYTTAILFFAGFALLLALIVVYGVAAFAVTERRHEIGIRIALGAKIAQIRFLLLRQSLLPLTLGLAAGLAGAFTLESSLQALIYDAPARWDDLCRRRFASLSCGRRRCLVRDAGHSKDGSNQRDARRLTPTSR